jgi:hypothetical protein|tara:strand:- start:196 stop:309 length:114 start_codon:yes stop_codon:yes gene_type:complete
VKAEEPAPIPEVNVITQINNMPDHQMVDEAPHSPLAK